MGVMLDIVGAMLLLGMIILTILQVNTNMSLETYKTASEFHTQTELIQLARIMEHDFYKMGYRVARPSILVAESSHVRFRTNLYDVAGASDEIEYILGTAVESSTNPRDLHMMRVENTTRVSISYSVTRFRLWYYDRRDSVIPTPITGGWLDSIRSVRAYLTLESPEPYDSIYAGAYYEKVIYPRNLQ